MMQVMDWFKRNRWATFGVSLLLVVGLIWANNHYGFLGDTAKPGAPAKNIHQAELISGVPLATGVDASCYPVFIPPMTECRIGLQPGNTLSLANYVRWEVAAGVSAGDIIAAVAGLLCSVFDAFPPVLWVCTIVVSAWVLNDIAHLYSAADAQRCFGVKFSITPGFPSRSSYAYGGASWHHPIWYPPYNGFIAQWRRDGSCAVNMTDGRSRYFYLIHCHDYIHDGAGGTYPIWTRFNYDGRICFDVI